MSRFPRPGRGATPRPARPDRSLPRTHPVPVGALALVSLLALVSTPWTGALAAQTIDGVALDEGGSPLPDVPVALHRVGGGSGAFAGSARTDGEGRFSFRIEAGDSALYFAAIRYGGRMYIGPAITGGDADVTGYEIRAVPGAEAGAVASALSGAMAPGARAGASGAAGDGMAAPARRGGGPGDTGALLLVTVLAVGAAAIFLTTAPRYRRRRSRDTMVDLATVENRLAGELEAPEREELEERSAALRRRLAPRG